MIFKHSGDIGDIIYSLPIIKAKGGGKLLLSTEQRFKYVETKFNKKAYNALLPLLQNQEYISDVEEFTGQKFDIDLDLFRFEDKPKHGINLGKWQARWHGLGKEIFTEPWLEADTWGNSFELFNYTPRYTNNSVDIKSLSQNSVYVGIKQEWDIFRNQFGSKIDFYPTKNLFEVANLMNGCVKFIGNQSSLFAIAVGLGIDAELIVSHYAPNCFFERDNIIYHK